MRPAELFGTSLLSTSYPSVSPKVRVLTLFIAYAIAVMAFAVAVCDQPSFLQELAISAEVVPGLPLIWLLAKICPCCDQCEIHLILVACSIPMIIAALGFLLAGRKVSRICLITLMVNFTLAILLGFFVLPKD